MPEHTPAPTPGRAVYGFAMYLSFKIFFILYLTWAVVPDRYFRAVGITCLPQRYWAVAIPVFLLTVLTIFAFIIYPGLGLLMTPSVDDMRTIQDQVGKKRKQNKRKSNSLNDIKEKSQCLCDKNQHKCYKEYFDLHSQENSRRVVPALEDLNIWDVSELLYSK